MNPDDRLLKSTKTSLSRWAGGNAAVWEMTVSLRTVIIRILRDDRPDKHLEIGCLDTEFIHGPTKWSPSAIEVHRIELDDGSDGFRVLDDGADFQLICGKVEVSEGVNEWV